DPDGSTSATFLVASGRSAALFALLAGVGLALASGGPVPLRGRALGAAMVATLVRAGVLAVVGLWLGGFPSGLAIILVYYALLFVVAVPVLGLSARALLPLAAAAAVIAPVVSQVLRATMPPPSYDNPTMESLVHPADLARELAVTGYYPVLTWTAYMLAGLAVGRLALATRRTATTVMMGGAMLAVAAWATSWLLLHPGGGLAALETAGAGGSPIAGRPLDVALTTSFFGTTPTTTWWWLAVIAPHSGSPFDLLHTIGTACFVLGAMLLVARIARVIVWPLAAVGSMTFTLYSLHVVLKSTVLPDTVPNALLWHVLIAVAIAVPWRSFVGRGPLEALAAGLAQSAASAVARPAVDRGG
ncbi:MAG: DUF1624 domain-containing protein, partial [Jiangellaceae bacterium]|nr:DUF1624 domain-containing protein [Jiangellaceae bacterium]